MRAHFEISVPVKGGGDAFLRIGVHDTSTNRFGVVEAPVASVAHLTPQPAAPARNPAPANATPASARPATD